MAVYLSLWHGETLVHRRVTMSEIVGPIAEAHGLTIADLKGQSRVKHIAHPRQEAMAACRAIGTWSYTQIATFFNRDHTTVLHGVRVHNARLQAMQEAA